MGKKPYSAAEKELAACTLTPELKLHLLDLLRGNPYDMQPPKETEPEDLLTILDTKEPTQTVNGTARNPFRKGTLVHSAWNSIQGKDVVTKRLFQVLFDLPPKDATNLMFQLYRAGQVVRVRHGKYIPLSAAKENSDEGETPVKVSPPGYNGGSGLHSRVPVRQRIETQVMNFMTNVKGDRKAHEIASEKDLNQDSVTAAMCTLAKNGWLVRVRKGVYQRA